MKPPRVRVSEDAPAGCLVAAALIYLVGLLAAIGFWTLVIVVLWKLAHTL